MIELPVMLPIPMGEFLMGSSDNDRFANATERPLHRVEITRPFAAARFPVTASQWAQFDPRAAPSELPVVNVSWDDVQAYLAWLRQQTSAPFRLLTECEWEYCCRAGTTTVFHTGDNLDPSQANYLYDEHGFKVGCGHRTPPGAYPANAFGLECMSGNVCEWVQDAWRPNYATDHATATRVIRGGAWDYLPRLLRSAWRDSAPSTTRRDNLGFRIACDL
jgi:formylglycine-generating enzyme required for sulfatase activity